MLSFRDVLCFLWRHSGQQCKYLKNRIHFTIQFHSILIELSRVLLIPIIEYCRNFARTTFNDNDCYSFCSLKQGLCKGQVKWILNATSCMLLDAFMIASKVLYHSLKCIQGSSTHKWWSRGSSKILWIIQSFI